MVEHKVHAVSMSVDSANSLSECPDQVFQVSEQHVRQDSSLQVSPKALNEIEARAVRWQPEDFDPIAIGCEPVPHSAGVMESAIVAHQADLAAGVRLHQSHQKDQEVHAALAVADRVRDLARHVVDAAVDDLFLVLARCRNFRLYSYTRPHPRQHRMSMDLHFVLEDKRLRSILLQGFFFNRRNRFLAVS
jgi:hypothetical protein